MADSYSDQRQPLEDDHQDRSGLTISDFFRILRKHVITMVVTFVVVVAAVVGLTMLTPTKFSSTVQLFATYNNSDESTNSSEQNSGSSYIMSQIKSYPTLTKTHSVLQPVIDELHLDTTSNALAKEIEVTNPAQQAFVNITVSDSDPQQAAKIANAVAASLSNIVSKSLYDTGNKSPVKLTIVQPGPIPTSPSSPNYKRNMLFGVIGALIIALVAAILKDMLSKTVQDDDEVTEYLDAPLIGRIPDDEILAGTTPAVVAEPGSPVAEDFRRIRTNLSFTTPVNGTNCRLLIIDSASASEGKTTTSVNVAAALAENGARVLLIDTDLRHPSVAKAIGIDNSAGLTHVLSGQASVKDVVQRYWKPNLHVMPAGPKPPNASTLLNSPIMTELVNNAILQYDYVLLDSAPLVIANDAVNFVRRGGSLIMVACRDKTLKHDLRDIAKELQTLDMPVSGIVFNRAVENKKALTNSNYYYYSESSQSNGKRKK